MRFSHPDRGDGTCLYLAWRMSCSLVWVVAPRATIEACNTKHMPRRVSTSRANHRNALPDSAVPPVSSPYKRHWHYLRGDSRRVQFQSAYQRVWAGEVGFQQRRSICCGSPRVAVHQLLPASLQGFGEDQRTTGEQIETTGFWRLCKSSFMMRTRGTDCRFPRGPGRRAPRVRRASEPFPLFSARACKLLGPSRFPMQTISWARFRYRKVRTFLSPPPAYCGPEPYSCRTAECRS